ncbi:transcription-repair coupling factor [Buchnera aphidicola (Formosaphis micheliae)]|uniref:transcription-repair coupling factor n=1 Tax=Buchnera aphidicola TaxID=9 RepID=UPI0031CC6164
MLHYNNNFFEVKKNNFNTYFNNLSELKKDQIVVHFTHGIGRYKGLQVIEITGVKNEYLILEYANKAKLYVPVTYLYLISRYTNFSQKNISLNKLGSDSWNKVKKKAIKKINDVATMLLDTYSSRIAKKGFAFHLDKNKYNLFCKDCPFEITSDQSNAINSVLCDMKKSVPMDRIICGDVGFGKTEVAMRAAFLAVSNNKQVVVLVPTTLLAQQHYNSFKKRFSNFSYKIEILSRLCSNKKQSVSIKSVHDSTVNILIGTHLLLFKKIRWNNLGLLIIDEEHRFGVQQKEYIKSMFLNIDIITLTATPIPRTLNMGMSGIRDMSIISTPPEKRLTVKTFIREYNDSLIKRVIIKEILRGGQVFYLCNEVKKIKNTAKKICTLVPEAKIDIGHGQMSTHELKKVMLNFTQNKINVLVCTAIIETGIDIPNVNTIIVEKADRFGLAQLHQLRGRVGRSYHQAYAWLLVSNYEKITPEAKKRFEAIISLKDFGSGLTLSMQDLEIRGIGEILGIEQSGHVNNIGITLYTELLNQAVINIKNNNILSLEEILNNQPEIELSVTALIPESYINSMNIRLDYYKKISSVQDLKELVDLKYELIYQFGSIPQEIHNLITVSKIRILSKKIGINYIKSNKLNSIIDFCQINSINIEYLLVILKKELIEWKFNTVNQLKLKHKIINCNSRITWILNFLEKINHQNNS